MVSMAIGRSIRPRVLVAGYVEGTRELKRKADNSVYANEVRIKQENDAVLAFTMYDRPGTPPIPLVGEFVAVECSVEESREYGTSLNFERPGYDALDLIQSALSGKSSKAA